MMLYWAWIGCPSTTLSSFVKKKNVVFRLSKEETFEYNGTP